MTDDNILETQTQSTDHLEYVIPDISALDSPDNEDSSNFDDDELLQEDPDGLPSKESEADVSIFGIVQTYFLELKEHLSREIALHKMPLCYQQGHFWIRPVEPYFPCVQHSSPQMDWHHFPSINPQYFYGSLIYWMTPFLPVKVMIANIINSVLSP